MRCTLYIWCLDAVKIVLLISISKTYGGETGGAARNMAILKGLNTTTSSPL